MIGMRNDWNRGVSLFGSPPFRRLRESAPLVLAALCFGCGGEDAPPPPISVELSVKVDAPDEIDPGATVHLSLYHAWTGDGDLRYPLEIIKSYEIPFGSFNLQFDYPVDAGDGLVVYAWVDADGDGANCTPTLRGDMADLVEVQAFPAEQVSVSLLLDAPCAGPDWFFPGPEPQ
ncbi:MAG: hypothetical protein F4013_04935 [Gammaproteobacteria bacterium]|nr:hypothetical protein [Gammaproteobacteria bacterium]MYL01050.1 hypothetical protein [Gammaproteobacteria bacterium]